MKKEKLYEAIGEINENYINKAHMTAKKPSSHWIKWSSIAACFIVMLATMLAIMPMLFMDDSPIVTPDNKQPSNEFQYESGYFYQINEGSYSTYIGGKVIAEDNIGKKIADVNLMAGWKNAKGEWKSETEALRGEVYAIDGVSNDVAVALKFIDQGEAVTTTHYYVIMNPNADLTAVEDYIIAPVVSNNSNGEILE